MNASEFDPEKHPRGEHGRFALSGSAGGHPAQIASANLTSVGADKDTYKQPSVASMMGAGDPDPDNAKLYKENFEHDLALFNDPRFYPNFRASELKGTPAERAAAIVKNMASNLVFLYQHATDVVRDHGMRWYDGAHNLTVDLAKQFRLDEASVAGAFAKLSPNKDWNQNVELGRRLVDIYTTKQDFRYDKAMTEAAKTVWSVKDINGDRNPNTDSQVYKDKVEMYAGMVKAIEGRTLAELTDPVERAAWIKTYDVAHNSQTFHQFLPSGEIGDIVRNFPKKFGQEGEPTKLVWQSTRMLADAVRALDANGDRAKISDLMGNGHKVRSFYNNILDPHSPNRDVTIDTHQVGAALMRSLGGKSVAVNHNFGLTPEKAEQPAGWKAASASVVTGLSGTYGFYADATRAAAKTVGVDPAALQAVTWETKRDTFGQASKEADAEVEKAWNDYRKGKFSQAETQERVWKTITEDVAQKERVRADKLAKREARAIKQAAKK